MSLPWLSLELRRSPRRRSPRSKSNYWYSRGSWRVVETTYLVSSFMVVAMGFSSGFWFGQKAAHSS